MARRNRALIRRRRSMGCRERERSADHVGKALGGGQPVELGGREPARLGELVVERDLARDPARRERQDHEMALDLAVAVARNDLAMAREAERLDDEAGLLLHLADDRLV